MRGAIGAVLAAGLLAGCGGGDSRTIRAGDGTTVIVNEGGDGNVASIQLTDGNGQTATMTATDGDNSTVRINLGGGQGGATITTGGGWPAGFGAAAPAYPGGTIAGSLAGMGPGGGAGGTVSFTTADAPERVIDFYKARATAAGMKVGMSADTGGTRMFTAGDERSGASMTVTAAAEGGTTTGSIIYGGGGR